MGNNQGSQTKILCVIMCHSASVFSFFPGFQISLVDIILVAKPTGIPATATVMFNSIGTTGHYFYTSIRTHKPRHYGFSINSIISSNLGQNIRSWLGLVGKMIASLNFSLILFKVKVVIRLQD